jgi:hypothetical protein
MTNIATIIAEQPSAVNADEPIVLSLDALVRSIGVRRGMPLALFLGAGASTSSGLPSAQMCVWEWKRQIFLTNNPGLEEQFSELSLDGVRRRIQNWFDRQGAYPKENSPEEYGFYINRCFPIQGDRRAYFQGLVRTAAPHIGYKLLCHLAEAEIVRSVWSPNFDGLAARAAANFRLAPIEVGIDSQDRVYRAPGKGELLCVSMHGDYRYDKLKNTPEELQRQEATLRSALIAELANTSIIVCGYSGRDQSLMDNFRDAYGRSGTGILYWCGFGDGDCPLHVESLIQHARAHGRQAYFVPAMGFDDLLTRLGLHNLQGDARKAAVDAMEASAGQDKLIRVPFALPKHRATTLIKSNAFAVECPAEVLRFDLKEWPKERAWSTVREIAADKSIVAVPFKGKIFAIGHIDAIKEAFGTNIKGVIERTPVGPQDLAYEDGTMVSLMREALTRSMAEMVGLQTDGQHEIWDHEPRKDQRRCSLGYVVHDSVHLYLRRTAGVQYLVLMPTIKVLATSGEVASREVANPTKLAILGYQHNKEFNQAVMDWRKLLLPSSPETIYEFPRNCGSSFRFKIRRSPVFGEIGLSQGAKITPVPDQVRPLVKYTGCPSSDNLRLIRHFEKGGSGSSGVRV